ncbi:hypothetical protein Tco_1272187 [Tanacetum coccineum]
MYVGKQEIEFEKVVEEPVVSVATTTKSILVSDAEVVTTASASVQIPDELTLAQTLIEIQKLQKPKPLTTVLQLVHLFRPKAKEIYIAMIRMEKVSASTTAFFLHNLILPTLGYTTHRMTKGFEARLDLFKEKENQEKKQLPYLVALFVEEFFKHILYAAKVFSISSHYKEPTELEIQEMVNILVSGEAYDKVFNHLHAPLEGKCGGMAWKFRGNLKLRGRLKFVSFMED